MGDFIAYIHTYMFFYLKSHMTILEGGGGEGEYNVLIVPSSPLLCPIIAMQS